jgi:hypothetical protein
MAPSSNSITFAMVRPPQAGKMTVEQAHYTIDRQGMIDEENRDSDRKTRDLRHQTEE